MIRLRHFFATTLLGGLTVILPITLLFIVARLVFNFFRGIVKPISTLGPLVGMENELLVDLTAIGVLLLFCFIVGLIVRTSAGSALVNFIERRFLFKLPFYKLFKQTVLQFLGQKEIPFSKVVLVDPFGAGTQMLGFVADEHADGNFTVFVPTGPNPTNGFVFHMLPDQVKHTKMKPEDAMRTIIGVGIGSSQHF